MMPSWLIFAVVATIICGLGYISWQKTQGQLSALESAGFVVSEDLGGNPKLVIDEQASEFALIHPKNYQRFPLAAITEARVESDLGRENEKNFRIELSLSRGEFFKVKYANEFGADAALGKLKKYLP
ncbi:MAG: hypothetical protein ACPGPF_04030 [Pontibacterium sp.]